MDVKKVLVTGMSGLIGGALRRRIEGRFELVALNRRDVPGVECHRADIGDLDAIAPAFEGVDVVVHLAALASLEISFEDNLRHNVVGTYNVFEAARRAGVRRVVFASSGAVVTGWEGVAPYDAITQRCHDDVPADWPKITRESPIWPVELYGCAKVWGEALARHYCDAHGMSMICLRIGRVTPEDRPRAPRDHSVWCSQRDIAQIIEKSILAPEDLRFDIFYGVSNNKWTYRDIDHARQVLGYAPEDSVDEFE